MDPTSAKLVWRDDMFAVVNPANLLETCNSILGPDMQDLSDEVQKTVVEITNVSPSVEGLDNKCFLIQQTEPSEPLLQGSSTLMTSLGKIH